MSNKADGDINTIYSSGPNAQNYINSTIIQYQEGEKYHLVSVLKRLNMEFGNIDINKLLNIEYEETKSPQTYIDKRHNIEYEKIKNPQISQKDEAELLSIIAQWEKIDLKEFIKSEEYQRDVNIDLGFKDGEDDYEDDDENNFVEIVRFMRRKGLTDSKVYALCIYALAKMYLNQHNYTLAEPLLLNALNKMMKLYGSEHIAYAKVLDRLGLLYLLQGNFEDSEVLLREALRITKSEVGAEHDEYAKCLNELAVLYRDQGKFAQAEAMFLEALRITEKIYGKEYATSNAILHNLAVLYDANYSYIQECSMIAKMFCLWVKSLI